MARKSINNAFYDELGEGWHSENDHPIALLRAENRVRNPWVIEQLQKSPCKVLDIGCGAGLLANPLALAGHAVTGIDLSSSSLDIAKKGDKTKSVSYLHAKAEELPFAPASFDAVIAMDLLEHVEKPELVIAEAARVLKPGGLFFFHTFNRNFLSWLVIIKGVEWCVKNSPKNMHVYNLFIKPKEIRQMCQLRNLSVREIRGLVPDIRTGAFWKMIATRSVPENFRFCFTPSELTGYVGVAVKEGGKK
jgi:2-polyprenyl-6-hydroxyphenyl methylase / 3-demethylubiquinone-9 3-methyltransferase